MENKNVDLSGKYLYALPHVDWNDATVRKKAEPYQPTSCSDWKSSVMRGIAVATMVCFAEKCGQLILPSFGRGSAPLHHGPPALCLTAFFGCSCSQSEGGVPFSRSGFYAKNTYHVKSN